MTGERDGGFFLLLALLFFSNGGGNLEEDMIDPSSQGYQSTKQVLESSSFQKWHNGNHLHARYLDCIWNTFFDSAREGNNWFNYILFNLFKYLVCFQRKGSWYFMIIVMFIAFCCFSPVHQVST